MKVALLVAKVEPGGLLEVNKRLAEALLSKGHQVELISVVESTSSVDFNSFRWRSLGGSSSSRSFFQLRALFSSREYDAVIVSQLFLGVIAIASRPKRNKTSLILVEHSSLDYWRFSPRFKDRIALMISKYLLGSKADCLASVSKVTTQSLNDQFKRLKRPAVYLPNPILSGHEPIFNQSGLDFHHRSNFIFVGRISQEKRLHDIINAYALIAARTEENLIILGDGPERSACELLTKTLGVEDRVYFHGYVANVSDYLRDAKCLVLASSQEGLPTVLVEALAFGASVISTDCPTGPREILSDGRFGSLIRVGDVHGLAKAMEESVNLNFDADALERHLQQYTSSSSVLEYERVIMASIATRRHSLAR
jgi:glycosyltransferase involved in cell wall biosynthesis